MKVLLVVAALIAVSQADRPVKLNIMVDQFLNSFRETTKDTGNDVIPISSLTDHWHYDGVLVDLNGKTVCLDGFIGSLSSLKRTGDVLLATARNVTYIQAELGLEDLNFEFRECKISHYASIGGHIKGTIDSNSVRLLISIEGEGTSCVAAIESVDLTSLGRLHLFSGTGFFHSVNDRFIELISRIFHKTIVENLNRKMNEIARTCIKQVDLCEKMTSILGSVFH